MHRLTFALAIAATSPLGVAAPKAADILNNYSTDLSMPDSPGLAIVGLSSENVLRPATPRALGLAIKQGRTANGSVKQGFALDFAPLKLAAPGTTKAEYAKSRWLVRPLWNTQVSVGAGQPLSDKDSSTRIGLGISTVLWRPNDADPLLKGEHIECLSKALSTISTGPFPGPGVGDATLDAATKQAIEKCRKTLEDQLWNATALSVGLAAAKVSARDPAVLPNATPRGYWVSFNYGFEPLLELRKNLQFTASYRRLHDEIVADPLDKSKFVTQDSHLLGAKIYGRFTAANVFVEASRQRARILGRETVRNNLFVLGAERKLADNLWLTLALGTQRGGTDGNPSYVSTGLKFGYSDSAVIKEP